MTNLDNIVNLAVSNETSVATYRVAIGLTKNFKSQPRGRERLDLLMDVPEMAIEKLFAYVNIG